MKNDERVERKKEIRAKENCMNDRIKANIRQCCSNYGIPYKELAKPLGLTESGLNNRLSSTGRQDRFKIVELLIISQSFNVPIQELVFGTVLETPFAQIELKRIGNMLEKIFPVKIPEKTDNVHLINAVKMHRDLLGIIRDILVDSKTYERFYDFDPDLMLKEYSEAFQTENLEEELSIRANICNLNVIVNLMGASYFIVPKWPERFLKKITGNRISSRLAKQKEKKFREDLNNSAPRTFLTPEEKLYLNVSEHLLQLRIFPDWKPLAEYYWFMLNALDIGDDGEEFAENMSKGQLLLEFLVWNMNPYIFDYLIAVNGAIKK